MKKIKIEPLVFYGLALLHIIYVWSTPVFVTQDGSCHLHNSKILIVGSGQFYSQYLELNLQLFPNWFSSVILTLFLNLFSPIISEKMLITLIIICIPLALRYALKSINQQAVFMYSIGYVLSSVFLAFGFYNSQWSIAFFCLFIGFFFKKQNEYSFGRTIVCSGRLLLIYFTHPVAFIEACFLVGLDYLRAAFGYFKNFRTYLQQLFEITLHRGVIILPSFGLFLVFYFSSGGHSDSIFENKLFFFEYLRNLVISPYLLSFDIKELILQGLFSVLVFGAFLCIWMKKIKCTTVRIGENLLALLLVNLCIYFFISGAMVVGSYLTVRIASLIYLTLILLAAPFPFPFKFGYLLISSTICFLFLIVRYPYQNKMSEIAENYIELGKCVKSNSTVLPLGFSNRGEIGLEILSRLGVFQHIGGYLGMDKRIISFDNYQA